MYERIEIIKQIDDRTREVWRFTQFGCDIVAVYYAKETKEKGKRKWLVFEYWNKYDRHRWGRIDQHPPLTLEVKQLALDAFIGKLRVCTWEEKR